MDKTASIPLLRGHHLICLHFYNGEGYDQDFVENLTAVIKKAEHRGVEISPDPDDICGHCSWLKETKCQYSQDADNEIKNMDCKALELLNLNAGSRTAWGDIRKKIPDIFHEWYAMFCDGCHWLNACEKNDFFLDCKKR